MGKVEEKRTVNIEIVTNQLNVAYKENNEKEVQRLWHKLDHLLNQARENQNRQSRKYGLLRLDYEYGNGSELGDFLSDTTLTPLDYILKEEKTVLLVEALMSLSEIDRTIVIEKCLYKTANSKLAKYLGLSDKTVKSHLNKALIQLRKKLQRDSEKYPNMVA